MLEAGSSMPDKDPHPTYRRHMWCLYPRAVLGQISAYAQYLHAIQLGLGV
jgi:hypothetical protein